MLNRTYRKKQLCLSCLKSLKNDYNGKSVCCQNPVLIDIGYKARAPKHNASKVKWKAFFEYLISSRNFGEEIENMLVEKYGLTHLKERIEATYLRINNPKAMCGYYLNKKLKKRSH